jgi:hypothetical protein
LAQVEVVVEIAQVRRGAAAVAVVEEVALVS